MNRSTAASNTPAYEIVADHQRMRSPASRLPLERQELRRRRARLVFFLCLGYTILSTLLWFALFVSGTDGGLLFGKSRVTLQHVAAFGAFFSLFWFVWSYGFYWLKYWLLKRAGLSREELRLVFGSRLSGFDLEGLLSRHPERTLRIIDMIARRGRVVLLACISLGAIYVQARENPTRESLMFGIHSSLFDAMVLSWWSLLTFHNNGVLGHMAYGAHSRVLDGIQGRANVLCVGAAWNAVKFVMVPMGLALSNIYPPSSYAALFAFIWLSYAVADFASEIFGSIWVVRASVSGDSGTGTVSPGWASSPPSCAR